MSLDRFMNLLTRTIAWRASPHLTLVTRGGAPCIAAAAFGQDALDQQDGFTQV
jgi:hypothetical protein